MTEEADATPPPTADVSIGIDFDLTCRDCEYDLRGLAQDGQCPECGLPISETLDTLRLRFANPAWINRLIGGVMLILACSALTVVLLILGSVWLADFGSRVMIIILPMLSAAGAVLISTRDPEHERILSPSIVALRVAASVTFCAGIVFMTMMEADLPEIVMTTVFTAIGISIMTGRVLMLFRLAGLADRMPHRSLARFTRFLAWMATVGTCMALGTWLGQALYPGNINFGNSSILSIILITTYVIGWVFIVANWTLGLGVLMWYRRAFRVVSKQAAAWKTS